MTKKWDILYERSLIYIEVSTENTIFCYVKITYELFIPFLFFVLAYEVTKILRNSLFTFLFCLACLALQNAKTEHIEMKIMKPICRILVALMKKQFYPNDMKSKIVRLHNDFDSIIDGDDIWFVVHTVSLT